VHEDRLEGQEHEVCAERLFGEPEGDERQHRDGPREDRVDRVEPGRGQPVHLLDAVVHAVELPEQRDNVCEPVPDVAADGCDQERFGELEPPRLGGHEGGRDRSDEDVEEHRRHDDRRDEPDVDEAPGHEEVRDVGAPSVSQDALVAAECEQPLQWHEDHHSDDEAEERSSDEVGDHLAPNATAVPRTGCEPSVRVL